MISSPPKGLQTQKEKTEKDGIRVENVWRVCKQQADATLDKQVLKDVLKKKNCRRERHRQYFKLLKKHTPVLFVLLVFLYLPLVLLQKPCQAGSAPKRRHIFLSSRLQTSAPFPTMSLILFSPPGSFCYNAAKHQKIGYYSLKRSTCCFRSHW